MTKNVTGPSLLPPRPRARTAYPPQPAHLPPSRGGRTVTGPVALGPVRRVQHSRQGGQLPAHGYMLPGPGPASPDRPEPPLHGLRLVLLQSRNDLARPLGRGLGGRSGLGRPDPVRNPSIQWPRAGRCRRSRANGPARHGTHAGAAVPGGGEGNGLRRVGIEEASGVPRPVLPVFGVETR